MLENEFMSEVLNYERVALGNVERHFLSRFCHKPISAYGLWKILEINKAQHKMAYKNVHKRVKRLYDLGLLEEVQGKFDRNAKHYKLTSRGLFEMLLVPEKPGFPNPDICNHYKNDIIVRNIVYQFFEVETIEKFELDALFWLHHYLTKCCETIMTLCDWTGYLIEHKEERKSTEMHYYDEKFLNDLPRHFFYAIRDEMKDFIFRILTFSGYSNNRDRKPDFPINALIRDKKFMDFLKKIRKEFDDGYKLFN